MMIDRALVASGVIFVGTIAVDLDGMRGLVLEGKYFFYAHALTEAKKDGIIPEDAVHVILTGEVIEEYPDRQRSLIFAMLPNEMPLHVICDYSQANVLLIVTVYIPDDRLWFGFKVRRKGKRK
jgi:hypothetical protein